MTREEFIRDVETFYDLEVFCREEEIYDITDVLYDEDSRDNYLEERLVDLARECSWRDLRRILSAWENDDGHEYYVYDDDECELRPATADDLRDLKDTVLDYMDDYGWPEEDDDDPEEDTPEEAEEDQEPTPDEDCSVTDMLYASFGCVVEIRKSEAAEAEEDEKAFFNLIV